ncbi:AAA domain-containing protein [Saccharopolyspora pogona]|uniref:AAA domain-containing protein n=1 Tax=Saccharopolyspora pogona TaxID=333966 RepID=UPI00168A0C20|nr:AAA domain-containing protein [Saccharopolyspora pogona]
MASAGGRESEALRKTASLVNYLADLTSAASRNPLRDISGKHPNAPTTTIWFDDLPAGVKSDPAAEEVLLQVRPVPNVAAPPIPDQLREFIDLHQASVASGPEPKLRNEDGSDFLESDVEDGPEIVRSFQIWLARWRAWAEEERRRTGQRELYETLEKAVRTLEQKDDEFEFVLAVGLFSLRSPNGETLFRHVLVEQAVPALDKSGKVTVTRIPGKRRFEDRELFESIPEYRPDRARELKNELKTSITPIPDEQTLRSIREWAGSALSRGIAEVAARPGRGSALPEVLTFSPSPALLLQRRTSVLVSEAYQRIAEKLRDPGTPVPVALAQLVINTERHERDQWLSSQGAERGDLLGADPLFPLPANGEQSRVLELLRTETGVVVQGPPGTGKTHTIANLVSALLAQGQRVLVTSRKDQALRVLREKIPAEVRKLCVLLAGGSKDAAVELERGLDALSQAVAATDRNKLSQEAATLRTERDQLRRNSAELNARIAKLRETEQAQFPPVVPGYDLNRYRGTLADIVREVLDDGEIHAWMPPVPGSAQDIPPLAAADLTELRNLLANRTAGRANRVNQEIPAAEELPSPSELNSHVQEEREAMEAAEQAASGPGRELARLPEKELNLLHQLGPQLRRVLQECCYATANASFEQEWVAKAVRDRLGRRNSGLWSHLLEVRDEARNLQERLAGQGTGFVVNKPAITQENLGVARGWLRAGYALLEHFENGGKLRHLIPPKRAQKNARELLDKVRVDGARPATQEQLKAALDHIEAEVATVQLAAKWADVGVTVTTGQVTVMLSELADNSALLDAAMRLGDLFDLVTKNIANHKIEQEIPDLPTLLEVLQAVPAAKRQQLLEQARNRVHDLYRRVDAWAKRADACPELAALLAAIGERDVQGYAQHLADLQTARTERDDELRCQKLTRTLKTAHFELADLWVRTAGDPVWQRRDVRAAWAWSRAEQFMQQRRDASAERRLTEEFTRIEDRIEHVTERLVAVEAVRGCLDRMSEDHVRALNTYRSHMSNIGAGTGTKTREFRRSARAAMQKAQDAVPAWVVPLPNLLENIAAERNRFDVLIVDEASQVGIEHLYLLWMAPRVIVVGDDKQCTPGASSLGRLDTVFSQLDEHLADLDEDIRRLFTPKSHLYEVLSARSGKDALIRLREHFRCVPEIINWSSDQFYDDGSGASGLIPLRERSGDSLPPLKVTKVDNAVTTGRETRIRNDTEAQKIVETLRSCIDDPAYAGKSFGVVVLRTTNAHIQLLENLINEKFTPEERQERQIRVGTAPNFQGDERDVVMLSLVVATPPHQISAESFRQAFNVAASRARDQMWLFTSLDPDQFKPKDLRASLLSYMQDPPSVFGSSPAIDEVSPDKPHKLFDSLFEQRVFLEIKKRGYHVVPQYPVGSRRLDLVVVGDRGRLAVECDGHFWHVNPQQQDNDARRDRELARMRWTTIRIRESEFTANPDRELAPIWAELKAKGIEPGHWENGPDTGWRPVELDTENDDHQEEEW